MAQEVVIVGGGAIGATIALELARRGLRPILLERGSHLGSGCSHGNAGVISPSHSAPIANPAALREGLRWILRPDSPFYIRPRPAVVPWLVRYIRAATATQAAAGASAIQELVSTSLELHADLAAQGLETGFERRGSLTVYESKVRFAKRGGHTQGEVLGPEEAREIEPALGPGIAGAVYHREEAHCDAQAYVDAVGAAAVEAGAEIRTGVEVRRLRRRGDEVFVQTSDDELQPQMLVLAAGVWSGRLARGLGIFLPLEGGKGYHVDLEPVPDDPRLPVLLQEARVIATPLRGRLRLSGTLEFAGFDLSISERRIGAIRSAASRVLGSHAGRRLLHTWAGLRPCTPDGLPVIGRLTGVILATGHAMKGLALAPVTAKLVAQLVMDEAPAHDLTPFRPERFRSLLPLC